jgi:hypothetical protein
MVARCSRVLILFVLCSDMLTNVVLDAYTVETQWHLLSLNIKAWFELRALASGGEINHEDGLTWTHETHDAGESHIAMASVDTRRIGVQIDRIIEYYRMRRPPKGVICWYLNQEPPGGDLVATLFARSRFSGGGSSGAYICSATDPARGQGDQRQIRRWKYRRECDP